MAARKVNIDEKLRKTPIKDLIGPEADLLTDSFYDRPDQMVERRRYVSLGNGGYLTRASKLNGNWDE
jgi:hypothetical protein